MVVVELDGEYVRLVADLDETARALNAAILENQDYYGKAECVLAAHHIERRYAVERPFERDGDLLLDFFSSQSGHLGDNLDCHVGDVGVGIDRQTGP